MLSRINSLRISVKLSLVYGIMMAVLIFATSACTAVGLYYTQYHQVEGELSFSIRYVLKQLKNHYGTVEEDVSGSLPIPQPPTAGQEEAKKKRQTMHHDVVHPQGFMGLRAAGRYRLQEENTRKDELELMPGVFLKITDAQGDVVYDSDMYSPSLQVLQRHIEARPPFWANPNFQVVESDNFTIYYKRVPVKIQGNDYELHFFKTITAENRLLALIQRMLLAEIVISIFVALLLGYFVSRRLLNPVRDITDTAKSIEISDLSRRIPVPPTRDELSELAETFNRMLDRIQKGFRQQQRFVSDASHELRTPVTVIKGYSDMLARWGSQDEEALREGLEAIRSEAVDMQELIEKLLFLARADQKRQIMHKEPLDMAPLVEDVFRKLELTDKEHDHVLEVNEPATVLADKVAMKQMLRIFLENAVKYTPAGGRISLSAQLVQLKEKEARKEPAVLGQQVLKITISDTGIGIPAEAQDKIFDRFYRVDTSRSRQEGTVGGTGLGLSIASWIAREHNMDIQVESQVGQGTSFMVYIPVI